MSRGRALLGDTVVLAFGTLGGRVVGILLLPLYTHALSRAEFGTVDLVLTGIDLVLPLLMLSVSEAVLRFAMSRAQSPDDVLRTALTFLSALAVAVAVGAGAASLWLPPAEVAVVAAVLVVQSVVLVLGAWSRATSHVTVFAVSGVAQALGVGLANVILLLVLDLGVRGFLLSLLVGYVCALAVLLAKLPVRSALAAGSLDRGLLRRMLAFSAPLVPNVALWWLTNISGRYVLALTDGVDAVGVFGVASRFPAILTMATTVFAQAWQLSANRVTEEGDAAERSLHYTSVHRYYAAVLVLLVATVTLLAEPLVELVVAPEFHDAWRAVPLLLVGAMFAALSAFFGAVYTAAHDSTGVFRTTLAAGVASLVLNALLVPRFGVLGAAGAIAACFAGLWLLRVADSQRLTPTSITPRLTLPALALLGLEVVLQYLPVSDGVRYGGSGLLWVAVILLFRRELADVVRRAPRLLRGGRSSDPAPSAD